MWKGVHSAAVSGLRASAKAMIRRRRFGWDSWHGQEANPMTKTPRQYDFGRNWRKKIVPLLECSDVVRALTFGLKLYDPNYGEGNPPWLCGRGWLNGQRVRPGCLSWYQPWGRCHHIAPFCWALGKRLFPELCWGFIAGELHTVVIGWSEKWEEAEWVMDILQFKNMTNEKSLAFAKERSWAFYQSLARYAASFFSDREMAFERFRTLPLPGDEQMVKSQMVRNGTDYEMEVMLSA
jgi:hypothetical protein